MKHSIYSIALLFSLILQTSCAPVSQKYYEKKEQFPLTKKQIEKKLRGQTVQLESIDFDAAVLFHDDMKITATNYAGDTDFGTWSLSDENLLCLGFHSWFYGDNRCYRIIEDNNHLIFFTPNGALSYTGTLTKVNEDIPSPPHTQSVQVPAPQPEIDRLETSKERFIRLARNCPDCNLSGVDLSNAQLNHANLAGANLSGVDFTNANLRQANLMGANLSGAKLIRANLPGANLSFTDLSNANLSGSNLIRANVTGATTTNTNVTGAHLESIQGTIQ